MKTVELQNGTVYKVCAESVKDVDGIYHLTDDRGEDVATFNKYYVLCIYETMLVTKEV